MNRWGRKDRQGEREREKEREGKREQTQIINIPFGKGEAKAIIKKEMMKKWQDRWDMDNSGRNYYSIQKCINAQGVNGRNRREETVLTRLRLDHTGLNKTLFLLGQSKSDECKITENAEHVLLYCRKYREERIRLKQKISQTEESGTWRVFWEQQEKG